MYKRLFQISLVLSLLFHIGTGLWVWLDKPETQSEKTVEITFIDSLDKQKLQIVDQNEKALNDEIPKNAKYLSRHNQRVVKETKASRSGTFKNKSGGMNVSQQIQQQSQKKTGTTAKAKQIDGTLPTLDKLIPKMYDGPSEQKRKTAAHQKGDPSQTSDHLKEVESGFQTLLNTREFKYYAYYSRIKSKIQQYWEPSIKGKIRKLFMRGKRVPASVDRITKLLIVLNKQGSLVGVKVLSASGVVDLDDAAVEAFESAAPFPNPPKGIIENDGTIKIRWDFVLEV